MPGGDGGGWARRSICATLLTAVLQGLGACAGTEPAASPSRSPSPLTIETPSPSPMIREPQGLLVLRASNRTGLLGVPLPEGATLIERTPGDPAAGRDPSERYALSATAAEIAAFFNREMPIAGWLKDAVSTPTALFFKRGNLLIGILMNRDGGTFTLMGS